MHQNVSKFLRFPNLRFPEAGRSWQKLVEAGRSWQKLGEACRSWQKMAVASKIGQLICLN
jgi:hypothetical protein